MSDGGWRPANDGAEAMQANHHGTEHDTRLDAALLQTMGEVSCSVMALPIKRQVGVMHAHRSHQDRQQIGRA